MFKTDIQAGGIYTNGKGNVRQVLLIDLSGRLKAYAGVQDPEGVQFRILYTSSGGSQAGEEGIATLSSFAAWAKGAIAAGASPLLHPRKDAKLIRSHLWNWERSQGVKPETERITYRSWTQQLAVVERGVLEATGEPTALGPQVNDYILEYEDGGRHLQVRKGWRKAIRAFAA